MTMLLLGFAGMGFAGYRRNRDSIALAPPTGRDTHLAETAKRAFPILSWPASGCFATKPAKASNS
jgi:hypothetical protein